MHQGLRPLILAVVLTLGALGLVPHLVAATPGNEATTETTRVDYDFCEDLSDTFTYCASLHGVIHTTTTPSGNQTASFHGESCTTEIFLGQVVYHSCTWDQQQELKQDGVFQVAHHSQMTEDLFDWENCTGQFVFQFVNGEIRAFNDKLECATPA